MSRNPKTTSSENIAPIAPKFRNDESKLPLEPFDSSLVAHVSILGSEPKDSQKDSGFTPGFASAVAGVSLIGAAMLGRRKEDWP